MAEAADVAAGAEAVDAAAVVAAVDEDEASPKSEPSFPSKDVQLKPEVDDESDDDDVLELPKFSRSQSAILSTTLSTRDVPELAAAAVAVGAVVAATAAAAVGVEARTAAAVAGALGLYNAPSDSVTAVTVCHNVTGAAVEICRRAKIKAIIENFHMV